MTDITKEVLKYRDCCRNLWNNYIKDLDYYDGTGTVIEEYFYEIVDKLFNAMIGGQLFHKEIELINSAYFSELSVEPNYGPLGFPAMWANPNDPNFNWQVIQLKTENNLFKYMEFFDWTKELTMDCQYIRVRLVNSEELPHLIGNDFLLDAWNVKYLKNE
jgi:hypothetical protein